MSSDKAQGPTYALGPLIPTSIFQKYENEEITICVYGTGIKHLRYILKF